MKIVTIDMDIIMEPLIQSYNGLVPRNSWDKLLLENNFKYLPMNSSHYKKIFDYVVYCCTYLKENQIHFIDDHGLVLNDIKSPCHIVNIDHHHDWGYTDPNVPDCASWVRHLDQWGYLDSYYWINNKTSEIAFTENITLSKVRMNLLEDFNNLLWLKAPDELYIVRSTPWIPPYYQSFYEIILEYCNNYYNTVFTVDCGHYNPNIRS